MSQNFISFNEAGNKAANELFLKMKFPKMNIIIILGFGLQSPGSSKKALKFFEAAAILNMKVNM